MFKNYIKTAARGLRKNRAHSFINIAGLSVGMAVALLIGLWVWDEISFNTYHQNYNRIVQVRQTEKFLGTTKVWDKLPYLLIDQLEKNYTNEFKHIVPAITTDGYSLTSSGKKLSAEGLFIDAGAPEMLTLKMLKGSRTGLKEPHFVLLSSAVAKALFGNTSSNFARPHSIIPSRWTLSGIEPDHIVFE